MSLDETEVDNPKKPKSTVRRVLVGFLVAILVLVAGAFGFAWWAQNYLDGMIERLEDPFEAIESRPEIPVEVQEKVDEGVSDLPVNILVLGSDSRISAGDPSQWQFGAQRTDAIMLVHISGDRDSAAAISIPRDTWVPIPGYGYNKINAAFSFGGPSLMIETVEQLTDIRIDHFVVTDFESFSTMTDALGGVTVNLETPLDSGNVYVPAGEQRLNGEEALAYVRQRKGLSGGDFSRVQRQQNWMRSIMREAFDSNLLTDAGKLTTFLQTIAKSVAVDEEFSIGEMRDLLLSARNLRSADIHFLTIPHSGTGWSNDGQSIVVLDEVNAGMLFDAIKNDELTDYLESDPAGITHLPARPE